MPVTSASALRQAFQADLRGEAQRGLDDGGLRLLALLQRASLARFVGRGVTDMRGAAA
jgi:hypothetical protein